jgi:exodeoxyribonuclease V gamma subunit
MIHLTCSNRTEELLAALVEAVGQQRRRSGPFAPVRLVVPSRTLDTYVKLGLAEALGIAANVEVSFLRRLLRRIAERVVPGARLLDARQVEGHLLALLHGSAGDALLERPVLAPVRDYLLAAGAGPEVVDRRRSQLAAQLGQLYDEYAASRPEMLDAWRARATLAEAGPLGGIEAWQRALWLAMFGPEGRAGAAAGGAEAGAGPASITLAELLAALGARPAAAAGVGPLHLFGFSYIARSYQRLLGALGRQTEVWLYTLNPCREFWEDLETVPELRRRLKRQGRDRLFPARAAAQPGLAIDDDPYGLQGEAENLPLRLWGRPGRENVRLLNHLTDGDLKGRFRSNQEQGRPPTLLGRLQDDVLERAAPTGPDPSLRADDSVTIIPCPGVRRELEVIAGEIWRLLDADPTLRLNQIAVVVPEGSKASYLAHVGAVFREAHDLPHAILDPALDLPSGGGQRLGDALGQLIALPLGSLTRRELLPLLTHPRVMGRLPQARAADWLRLAEEAGILHGADHGDHQGTYIEADLVNWDQGMRRVVLGTLMGEGESGADRRVDGDPVALGGHQYLPLPRTSDEEDAALGFCLLARSLIEDARFAAGVTGPRLRPLPEWLELCRGLVTSYLVPADSDEEALLARCLAEIEALEEMPLGDTRVAYRVAADLVLRGLAGLDSARGQVLAHGVSVTSFAPIRAVPFRVVFVAGLGQRGFPAGLRRSELDLRAARRLPGDVTPREQDLYLFLETLLSARERLVLTYVARDELTGTPLEPSPVILELCEILATGYLEAAEMDRLLDGAPRPPLRRYDDAVRAHASTLSGREARAKALARSLRAALPPRARLPDLPALRRALPRATFEAVAAQLGVHEPPELPARRARPAARAVEERVEVSLSALRQFLEDPLQGSARYRLGMREIEGEDEIVDRRHEPFETDRMLRTLLARETMLRALVGREPGWEEIEATLDRLVRRAELAGEGPTGFFAAAERPALREVVRGLYAGVTEYAAGRPLQGRVLRFGAPFVGETVAVEARDPIVLSVPAPQGPEGRMLRVEIVGRTELLVFPDGVPASLFFACRKKASGDFRTRLRRDRLRGFVDHLVRSAAGLGESEHGAPVAWAVTGEHTLFRSGRFRPVAAETARAYLASIVTALLTGARDGAGAPTGVHPYLLPCEAVFRARKAGSSIPDEVQSLRDVYLERSVAFSSVTGPVPEAVERHDPPPADVAQQMADARFGLFFDLLEEGKDEG